MKDKLGNNVKSDATLEWYLEYTPSFAVAEATSKVKLYYNNFFQIIILFLLIIYIDYDCKLL